MRRALSVLLVVTLPTLCACPPDRPAASSASSARSGASSTTNDGTIELVESAPVETTLDHPSIPNASDVWVQMLDAAKASVDFAEFYASEADDPVRHASKLTPVLDALDRAIARKVHVRFLADSIFAPKYPDTLERLRRAGADVRILDEGKLAGGVLHAKYFVVDGADAYLGSQNFDWRALSHIHEMGVHARSPRLAGALMDVFETDWQLAAGAPKETRVTAHGRGQLVPMKNGERVTFAASPRGWLPDEAEWDLPLIVAALDRAQKHVELQVLTYKTKDRAGDPFFTLHEALLRAAARGVQVSVVVSDWSAKPGSDARAAALDLAKHANVEARVITIPPWSGGDIPFARVAHAKYLVVDEEHAWVGTSNWEGDYFTKTRNVGVVVDGGALPHQLHDVFTGVWSSAYVKPLGG